MIQNYFRSLFRSAPEQKMRAPFDGNFFAYSNFTPAKSLPENYKTNVIVYRCVNIIAQSASHVPWLINKYQNNHYIKLEKHELYHLFKRPNNSKAGADFFCELITNLLLFGNAYLTCLTNHQNRPSELYLLPSGAMQIAFTKNSPSGYKYNSANGEKFYPIDPITNMSKILHIKNFNPFNQHYGLSCLDAAAKPIELHSEATNWNSALLKNGARPSGALIVKDSNNYLTDEQFERLNQELTSKFTGSNNSGKPLLLEGGLDWREMSVSPKDMDFIESKNSAAREIALAFGVPPQLLGINGDSTYNNMQEARLALWEETLIPLLDKLADAFSCWLSYWYNEDLSIDFDRDAISALTEKRENLWAKVAAADFMTLNEKRLMMNLPAINGGDTLN